MMYIEKTLCNSCGICVDVCPVAAISITSFFQQAASVSWIPARTSA